MPSKSKVEAAVVETEASDVDMALLTTAPDGVEFETVVDESPSRIIFETHGDVFVGQYEGMVHIDQEPDKNGKDQSFDLYTFRGRDGNLYSVNNSYKVAQAADKMPVGSWVRMTYVKDVDTRNAEPMKDIKVEVSKS